MQKDQLIIVAAFLYESDVVVVHSDEKDRFVQHINDVYHNIRFTEESSNDDELTFLDWLISREKDGSSSTSAYSLPILINTF